MAEEVTELDEIIGSLEKIKSDFIETIDNIIEFLKKED